MGGRRVAVPNWPRVNTPSATSLRSDGYGMPYRALASAAVSHSQDSAAMGFGSSGLISIT